MTMRDDFANRLARIEKVHAEAGITVTAPRARSKGADSPSWFVIRMLTSFLLATITLTFARAQTFTAERGVDLSDNLLSMTIVMVGDSVFAVMICLAVVAAMGWFRYYETLLTMSAGLLLIVFFESHLVHVMPEVWSLFYSPEVFRALLFEYRFAM